MSYDRPNILVVQGDIVVRHALTEYLRGCGMNVHEVASAAEARTTLEAASLDIDVVLCDMQTVEGGFDLASWIRSSELGVDTILCGSTAKAVEETTGLCEEGGEIVDPYNHQMILDRIRSSLANRAPEAGHPSSVKNPQEETSRGTNPAAED